MRRIVCASWVAGDGQWWGLRLDTSIRSLSHASQAVQTRRARPSVGRFSRAKNAPSSNPTHRHELSSNTTNRRLRRYILLPLSRVIHRITRPWRASRHRHAERFESTVSNIPTPYITIQATKPHSIASTANAFLHVYYQPCRRRDPTPRPRRNKQSRIRRLV